MPVIPPRRLPPLQPHTGAPVINGIPRRPVPHNNHQLRPRSETFPRRTLVTEPQRNRQRIDYIPFAEVISSSRQGRPTAGGDSSNSAARLSSQIARGEVLQCAVSALILLVLLGTYLGIVLSDHSPSEAFTIIMVLGILICTVFFLHTLFRLHILRQRISFSHALNTSLLPKRSRFHYSFRPRVLRRELNMTQTPDKLPNGDTLYAPRTPLRVHLIQDEEAALPIREDENGPSLALLHPPVLPPPPAYGLWRCSVRADPRLLFWQPTNATPQTPLNEVRRPVLTRCPPSYVTQAGWAVGAGGVEERRRSSVQNAKFFRRRSTLV